jgi:hypothetical protein
VTGKLGTQSTILPVPPPPSDSESQLEPASGSWIYELSSVTVAYTTSSAPPPRVVITLNQPSGYTGSLQ